jgi:hypothetical protein
MRRTFVATPLEGLSGSFAPKSLGRTIQVRVRLEGEVLDTDAAPDPSAQTVAQLKSKFRDPRSGSLRIPQGASFFTISPEALMGVPETALVVLYLNIVPA